MKTYETRARLQYRAAPIEGNDRVFVGDVTIKLLGFKRIVPPLHNAVLPWTYDGDIHLVEPTQTQRFYRVSERGTPLPHHTLSLVGDYSSLYEQIRQTAHTHLVMSLDVFGSDPWEPIPRSAGLHPEITHARRNARTVGSRITLDATLETPWFTGTLQRNPVGLRTSTSRRGSTRGFGHITGE